MAQNWGRGGFVPPHTPKFQGEIFNTSPFTAGILYSTCSGWQKYDEQSDQDIQEPHQVSFEYNDAGKFFLLDKLEFECKEGHRSVKLIVEPPFSLSRILDLSN
ncbi:MAG: hypothetical protein LBU18_06010 [Treponema sp.]|jgi:hypothetical protein|nr:hypothetical protein [Treponema sp.]